MNEKNISQGKELHNKDKSITPDMENLQRLKDDFTGETKPKRGRKSKQTLNVETENIDDTLFNQENWQEIASLYFNARFVMTGHEGFLLSDNQKAVLASTLSMALKTLITVEPKWLALGIFSINFMTIVAEKEISYSLSKTTSDNKQ